MTEVVNEWPLPWLDGAWQRLQLARSSDRLPHAMLFVGAPGIGKRSLAFQFSRALLCRAGGELACGSCASCVQFDAGGHPDFQHLMPDEKTGNFKIEAIRELGRDLALTSQYGGYRVAVLEGIEGFTTGAANALLKTLEEPPSGVLLLLLTPWPGRLMATVRSRCQQLRCALDDRSVALQWLAERGVENASQALVLAGEGPLRVLELSDAAGLSSLLSDVLPKLASGGLGLAGAAKLFEAFQAREIAAAMIQSLEQESLQQSQALFGGLDIACLGARRSAQMVFMLRDRLLQEYRLDPTGLNQQAAIERLMMLVARGR